MEAGRVCTGFSKPYVAKLTETKMGNTWMVGYKDARMLARGVSVSIEPENSDDNEFFADNGTGESGMVRFTRGDLTLTVDGLNHETEQFLMGTTSDGSWITYGDSQQAPIVGVGFIARYQSGGTTVYVPMIIRKCQFNQISTNAETQEEQINWQTQELSAKILKTNDIGQWKWIGIDYDSELKAENAIRRRFNLTQIEEA